MTKRYEVVYVPGTWDLFHVGHLRLLKRASKIADCMIVGVDTDESVKKDKGEASIVPYIERVKIVEAIRWINRVVWNSHDIPNVRRLRELKVDAVVLGSDWKNKPLKGKREAEMTGIPIVYFSYTKGISSSEIKGRLSARKGGD